MTCPSIVRPLFKTVGVRSIFWCLLLFITTAGCKPKYTEFRILNLLNTSRYRLEVYIHCADSTQGFYRCERTNLLLLVNCRFNSVQAIFWLSTFNGARRGNFVNHRQSAGTRLPRHILPQVRIEPAPAFRCPVCRTYCKSSIMLVQLLCQLSHRQPYYQRKISWKKFLYMYM